MTKVQHVVVPFLLLLLALRRVQLIEPLVQWLPKKLYRVEEPEREIRYGLLHRVESVGAGLALAEEKGEEKREGAQRDEDDEDEEGKSLAQDFDSRLPHERGMLERLRVLQEAKKCAKRGDGDGDIGCTP
jgi:hypothetical protein